MGILRAPRTTAGLPHTPGTTPTFGVAAMAWFILFLAGTLEIAWAIGLRHTRGWTEPLPSVLTIAAMVASLALLGVALRDLPLGTAYAVWTGIGVVGTAMIGISLLGESADPVRIASIMLILLGVAGLKLSPT